jgi:hypothetical protein
MKEHSQEWLCHMGSEFAEEDFAGATGVGFEYWEDIGRIRGA